MTTQNENSDRFLNIKQAATTLKVTDKTIRNYLDRGILQAEKWNGAWRIPFRNIIEVYYKKYGKKLENISVEQIQIEATVQISRDEYDRLQQCAGRLEGTETALKELKAQNKALNERVGQLEASSASGWTEARKFQEDLESLKSELQTSRKHEESARTEAEWLRRELERLRQEAGEREEQLEGLQQHNSELEERLEVREAELEDLRKAFEELQKRSQRDSFLD